MRTVRRVLWLASAFVFTVIVPMGGQQRSALSPAVAPFVSVDAPIVALTHVRVVDGTGAPAREDQTVILDGARFGSIGPFASTQIPPDARVVDLANHTVVPGLVGLHEHTYFGGVSRATPMNVTSPLLYLAYGVTTGMTAGSMFPVFELNLKRAIDDGSDTGTAPVGRRSVPRRRGVAKPNVPEGRHSAEAARRAVTYWSRKGRPGSSSTAP